MILRLLITQSQASFLVRKDMGVVRLQGIRNQMKAIGAACDIKLYDDKGQSELSGLLFLPRICSQQIICAVRRCSPCCTRGLHGREGCTLMESGQSKLWCCTAVHE